MFLVGLSPLTPTTLLSPWPQVLPISPSSLDRLPLLPSSGSSPPAGGSPLCPLCLCCTQWPRLWAVPWGLAAHIPSSPLGIRAHALRGLPTTSLRGPSPAPLAPASSVRLPAVAAAQTLPVAGTERPARPDRLSAGRTLSLGSSAALQESTHQVPERPQGLLRGVPGSPSLQVAVRSCCTARHVCHTHGSSWRTGLRRWPRGSKELAGAERPDRRSRRRGKAAQGLGREGLSLQGSSTSGERVEWKRSQRGEDTAGFLGTSR